MRLAEFTELINDYTNDSGYVHIPKTLLIDAVDRLFVEDGRGERK